MNENGYFISDDVSELLSIVDQAMDDIHAGETSEADGQLTIAACRHDIDKASMAHKRPGSVDAMSKSIDEKIKERLFSKNVKPDSWDEKRDGPFDRKKVKKVVEESFLKKS